MSLQKRDQEGVALLGFCGLLPAGARMRVWWRGGGGVRGADEGGQGGLCKAKVPLFEKDSVYNRRELNPGLPRGRRLFYH